MEKDNPASIHVLFLDAFNAGDIDSRKGPFCGERHEKLQWLGKATKAVSVSYANTGERSADGE
jgi:hypothetical protein